MLSTIEAVNSVVNNFIWGVPAMICIIGVGLYLSIRTRFLQIRKFPYSMKVTLGRMMKKKEASDGALTPFQAVCTALAATVGTGNVAGVAGAIAIGGPGAVFWMWLMALVGGASAFVESTLAQIYKRRNPTTGESYGGPAYYIEAALHSRPLAVLFALSLIAMLFAHLLMYKMVEGSKHFLTFIAAGIFIVSMLETRYYKKAVLLGAAFLYLYSFKAVEPYDYQIPYVTEERQAQVEYWREIFSEKLAMDTEQVPNYENVVIWTFGDETPEGHQNLKWQLLYSAPKGFGISCCEREYITEHLTELQSRYLATVSGGAIDEMCRTAGYEELGRDADMVLYRRY